MNGHRRIQMPNRPSGATQSNAEFRLFTGNQGTVVATHDLQGSRSQQYIATETTRFAGWRAPAQVTKAVVDRAFGITLAPGAADGHDLRMGVKKSRARRHPRGIHLAVTVDKKHKLDKRKDLEKFGKPGVSGARGSKRYRGVKVDDVNTDRLGKLRRAVSRARVDVDHRGRRGQRKRRTKTATQSITFVATDGNDTMAPVLDHELTTAGEDLLGRIIH